MTQNSTPEHVLKIIEDKGGIMLDVACGENKQPGFVGMDVRAMPGVDIVHNVQKLPWPLPDNCVISSVLSHIVEHIPPHDFIFVKFMDELWRVTKVGCRAMVTTPYAGSPGYWQDPTHCNGLNEATIMYFDPNHKSGLWNIYKSRPWKIVANAWCSNGNLEFVIEKLPDDREKMDY